MTSIEIYRLVNGVESFFTEINPDSSSAQVKRVMGENQLTISFEDSRYLQFKINDYCTVFDETYKISSLPTITKVSQYKYLYGIVMHAEGYDLSKAQFLFLGADNSLRESDFSLMGTAEDFLDLILQNANRAGSGWIKGQVIATEHKNLTFSQENCYNALSRLAEAFSTEFAIEGKTIHITKRTNDTGFIFRHGRNKGLYEITRTTLNDSTVITRLFAFGAEKNLPPEYLAYSRRLRFPGGFNPCLISNLMATIVDNGNGTQTFTFTWDPPISAGVTDVNIEYRLTGTNNSWVIDRGLPATPRMLTVPVGNYEFRFRTYGPTCWFFTPGLGVPTEVVVITATTVTPLLVYTPLPFIERNTGLYGVIEHSVIFEDIYPRRTGTVTAVDAGDPFVFTDTAIDFDVNAQLLPGADAKVVFNTGQLAGYEFKIQSFNNGTKQFRIQRNEDDRVLELPSALLRPAIGDTYVLVDIKMPQTYIDAAEAELLAKANETLVQLSEPQLAYSVTIDPTYMRRTGRRIRMSDLVWIQDGELEIQKKIRVVACTRNLQNEDQYTVELSDIVTASTINNIINAAQSTDRDVRDISSQLLNNSILNNRVIGTLQFSNIPETSTMTGFSEIVIENTTGKLYKKV